MVRRILLGLFAAVVAGALFFVRAYLVRPRSTEQTAISSQLRQSLPTVSDSLKVESRGAPFSGRSEPISAASEADRRARGAQPSSSWKQYDNSEYGFEISYPADWEFDSNYENNYNKPPSGHGRPAYAGETRTLFGLEMDGPDQSHEGGGEFSDGAIIDVQITGTSGKIESWNIARDRPWYLLSSAPADWVKLNSSLLGGDNSQTVSIDTNGFKGAVHVACSGSNPCLLFGEEGGVYQALPSGRVLLISWERMVGRNDFSYQKYFLPMLSSFRLVN